VKPLRATRLFQKITVVLLPEVVVRNVVAEPKNKKRGVLQNVSVNAVRVRGLVQQQ